jgi:hypothetical protein
LRTAFSFLLLERLGDHRRACAKHNVAPSAERYVAGRNEGLKRLGEVDEARIQQAASR